MQYDRDQPLDYQKPSPDMQNKLIITILPDHLNAYPFTNRHRNSRKTSQTGRNRKHIIRVCVQTPSQIR